MARVLVIEPDAALRTTLCELLTEDGSHAVEAVGDGTAAVSRLAVAPEPDVVVLDASVRELLHELLAEADGHAVETVADGSEAVLRLALSQEPRVVVLDAHLGAAFFTAEKILELARLDILLPGHAFVLVTTDIPATLPLRLGRLCDLVGARIVWMPFENDYLLEAVAAAAASLRPPGASTRTPPDGSTDLAS